jgi:hypothetical protein
MTRTRRTVLAALGTALVPGGCLATPSADDADGVTTTNDDVTTTASSPPPRRVGMGESVTVGPTTVSVGNPTVRAAVAAPGPAHLNLVAAEGQYVVADVTVDGGPADPPLDITLRSAVDDRTLPEGDPFPAEGSGRFAFPFPAEAHDAAAVAWTTDERDVYWTLPDATLDALATKPQFSLTDLRVPRRDGQRVLEMTVRNDGERDAHFTARVSLAAFSGGAFVDVPVPAGDSRTYTGRPGDILLYLENQGGGTLTVQYPAADGLTTVERAVESGTATPAN